MRKARRRVLIADDDPVAASVVQFNLEEAGYDVTAAGDGAWAWRALNRNHFDLVVLDYQMPELNADAICAKMRTDPRYRETPIILLTAKAFEIDMQELQAVYALAAVIIKPFSPGALVRTLAQHGGCCEARPVS